MDAIQNIAGLFGLKSLLIWALIFVPLERILTLRPQQKILRKGLVNDLVYATFNAALINYGGGMLLVAGMSTLALLVPTGLPQAVSGQATWLQVIEIIILTDLGVYVAHRTFHTIPALWRFHSIHHAVEEMDWIATFRAHPVDEIITKFVSLLPVYLLGFSMEAIVIYFLIHTVHGLLIHSNVKMTFGPLKWLIATPQFHHWHHANERAAYNKNFAGQLAIIDKILGTFQLPSGSETPQKYGVDDPIPSNYFGQIGYPFLPRTVQERGEAVGMVKPASDA